MRPGALIIVVVGASHGSDAQAWSAGDAWENWRRLGVKRKKNKKGHAFPKRAQKNFFAFFLIVHFTLFIFLHIGAKKQKNKQTWKEINWVRSKKLDSTRKEKGIDIDVKTHYPRLTHFLERT